MRDLIKLPKEKRTYTRVRGVVIFCSDCQRHTGVEVPPSGFPERKVCCKKSPEY